MVKQYRDIGSLINEFGLSEAITYKLLELRDRSPLANKLLSGTSEGHSSSIHYFRSCVAHLDREGGLAYFNANPKYPEAFTPIDILAYEPMPELSGPEMKKRLPVDFARAVSKMKIGYKAI